MTSFGSGLDVYSLDTKLKFGKYKGSTIEEVINEDPKYVAWCVEEVENFELDNRAYKYLSDSL